MSSYPIDLQEIQEKVRSKRKRRAPKYNITYQATLNYPDFYPNVKTETNEFNEKITRVDGDIPVDLPIKEGERFLFISYDQTILTHGLHKYPAKFFPELPRWLIKRYSKQGDIILDPFSGSGTTNVEALLTRRNSVGIDVDPFSRYLARTKTTPLDIEEVDRTSSLLLQEILHFKPSLVRKSDIPDFPYRDNWFNREIVLELTFILTLIEDLHTSTDIKNFYRVCFSSILRAVSNADNNCTRTVIRKKLNKQVYPADALTKFAETVLINLPKIKKFSTLCDSSVSVDFPPDNDARNIHYPNNYFDLAVTSPPYVNAVDYPRTHQLEMYWLGFAKGSLTPLKREHVGTESVSVEQYREFHTLGIEKADKVLKNIYEKDKRRSYIAYKYLIDMRDNLKEVYRTLKNNGRYIVVVGNNRIRGELFENWRYIKELAKNIGYTAELQFGSEIIKHFIKVPRGERINTDWVLVLRK